MKPIPGICDRCGQRYPLAELKFEYVLGKRTNLRTCPECYDESHPQLDTRNVRTVDEQSVPQSRPDSPEFVSSRAMFGWNPVGGGNTSTYVSVSAGRVTVNAS